MKKKVLVGLVSLIVLIGVVGVTFNKLNAQANQARTEARSKSIKKSKKKSKKISHSKTSTVKSVSSAEHVEEKPQADTVETQATAGHTPASEVQAKMVAPFDQNQPKTVYLTFDDGPSTNITNQVLATLARYKIKATFFVVGNQIGPNTAQTLKNIYNAGHGIGIHSYNHTYDFEKTGNVQQTDWQYKTTLNAIRNVLGPDFSTTAWRYPGGHMSWSRTLAGPDNYLKQNGLAWIDWNAAVGDALGARSPRDIKGQLDYLALSLQSYGPHNATVVLMHDSNPHQLTLDALPQVIEYFQSRGYQFGSMQ